MHFLKLDDIASQFDDSTTTFNLTLGGQAFFAGNPYSFSISWWCNTRTISSFTIVESQINFASAPMAGADFFIVVLATTNVDPLHSLTVGTRSAAHQLIYMVAHLQLKIVVEIIILSLLT